MLELQTACPPARCRRSRGRHRRLNRYALGASERWRRSRCCSTSTARRSPPRPPTRGERTFGSRCGVTRLRMRPGPGARPLRETPTLRTARKRRQAKDEPAVGPRPTWTKQRASVLCVRVEGDEFAGRSPAARERAPVRVRFIRGSSGRHERKSQPVQPTPHSVEVGPAVLVVVRGVDAASTADVGADSPAVQVG